MITSNNQKLQQQVALVADTSSDAKSKFLTTNDGVRLHYLEAGSGVPLVMVPGWSQTAAEFKHQLVGLKDHCKMFALDMRGHGASEKPDFGYTIARFSQDLHDALRALDLDEVNLFGHSLGCSVIWSYLELFGAGRISKLLLIDQMPCILSNPAWTLGEREAVGAILDCASLYDWIGTLAGAKGAEFTRSLIDQMVSAAISQEDRQWITEQNQLLPRYHAATLFFSHSTQDWRATIRRIRVPTLIVGARKSIIPWKSQVWIHEQIPGSRLEIFEENETGSHFMFFENPNKFNRLVKEFLAHP